MGNVKGGQQWEWLFFLSCLDFYFHSLCILICAKSFTNQSQFTRYEEYYSARENSLYYILDLLEGSGHLPGMEGLRKNCVELLYGKCGIWCFYT